MEDSQEVSLIVEGQIFKAKKGVLCEHSDYFRLMFNGNYVEQGKTEIEINIVDADSMKALLHYMKIGLIDLSEYSLNSIATLAAAANFLQITEIIKQIELCLELKLSYSNWMEILAITENSSYKYLKQVCIVFGLVSFNSMKPEYITNIEKLFWYLSHPYLDSPNELDVFKLGLQWILDMKIGPDALLIIVGCLDLRRVTMNELKEIDYLLRDYESSLAAKVIKCLLQLSCKDKLRKSLIVGKKNLICQNFSESVYNEVLQVFQASHKRVSLYTPVVPMIPMKITDVEPASHNLHAFYDNIGLRKWINVAEKNLWGWNIVTWDGYKLVLVCGEHGRGASAFMKDIKVYDIFKKEWTCHGVQLPSRRHGGVAVHGDLLYIIGGVGGFRVILDKAIVYNLKERTFKRIANLPETLQNPAVCVHKHKVYTAGQRQIYRYEETDERDRWFSVLPTDIRINSMISFKNHIYCTQNYFNQLYRFNPDLDFKLELVTCFVYPPVTVCSIGDRLVYFGGEVCGGLNNFTIEEYKENKSKTKVLCKTNATRYFSELNTVAGSCSVILTPPSLKFEISPYHKQYLTRYTE